MDIEYINFGGRKPERAHPMYDVGADVYTKTETKIPAGATVKIPLGFGIKLPQGLAGFIVNRSGVSLKGFHCLNAPIDPGYRGEVHAIVSNDTLAEVVIPADYKIAQLVVVPVVMPNFVTPEEVAKQELRGTNGFGSSGFGA